MTGEISVQLNFHDDLAISLAGVTVPNPAKVKVLSGAVPRAGEVVRFSGVNYKSGELAIFRVVSVAHLLGGASTQRIQLNLELVVLHQP